MTKTIGGEFELCSLPHRLQAQDLTQGLKGSWTISGRAALYALLKNLKAQGIRKVLLPAYLCHSVVQAVKECGLKVGYYPVSETLAALPQPESKAAVLLIHYFGWLNPSTSMLRRESTSSFVLIEDFTQSVLSSWKLSPDSSSLLFFSMRKLGPVPLGGWFNQEVQLPAMPDRYKTAFWKSVVARLLKFQYMNSGQYDLGSNARPPFLQMFQSVEHTLDLSAKPCRLDAESKRVIMGIDWQDVALARKRNWITLHALLAGSALPFHDGLSEEVTPFGYILNCNKQKDILNALSAARIICPVHWPLPPDIDKKRFPVSHRLSRSLVTIPIDQRYGLEEMEVIARVIHTAG